MSAGGRRPIDPGGHRVGDEVARRARIARLQAQVAAGEYRVPALAVADAVIAFYGRGAAARDG